MFAVLRIYRHRPFYFGRLTNAAYRVLALGIMTNVRGSYLLGAIVAGVQARMAGEQRILLAEFGVASGSGLRELARVAGWIERFLDVRAVVLGFDSGEGLPQLVGFRDHPELWDARQFPMNTRDSLVSEFSSADRRLVLGDIRQTIRELDASAYAPVPIGFVAVDVDLYSSAKPVFEYLGTCRAERLLPAAVVYCDDAFLAWTYSAFAGEELAVNEFNRTQTNRRLDLKDRELRLFALNCLDHPLRTGERRVLEKMTIVIRSASAYLR